MHVQKAEDALQGVWTLPTGTGSRQAALGNLYVAAKISPLAVSPKKSFQGGDHTNMCWVVRVLYYASAETIILHIKHQSSPASTNANAAAHEQGLWQSAVMLCRGEAGHAR